MDSFTLLYFHFWSFRITFRNEKKLNYVESLSFFRTRAKFKEFSKWNISKLKRLNSSLINPNILIL